MSVQVVSQPGLWPQKQMLLLRASERSLLHSVPERTTQPHSNEGFVKTGVNNTPLASLKTLQNLSPELSPLNSIQKVLQKRSLPRNLWCPS